MYLSNNNNNNNNNNKLMIIISDGDETSLSAKDGNTPSKRKSFHITQNLINMGMCQSIADNKITMVFIAIGYYPEKNLNTHNYIDWKKCVGEKNYYVAHNAHELETELLKALGADNSNEVGRNIPKQ